VEYCKIDQLECCRGGRNRGARELWAV